MSTTRLFLLTIVICVASALPSPKVLYESTSADETDIENIVRSMMSNFKEIIKLNTKSAIDIASIVHKGAHTASEAAVDTVKDATTSTKYTLQDWFGMVLPKDLFPIFDFKRKHSAKKTDETSPKIEDEDEDERKSNLNSKTNSKSKTSETAEPKYFIIPVSSLSLPPSSTEEKEK